MDSSWVYLMVVTGGWVAAQVLKYLIYAVRRKNFKNLALLYQSGGMPSAHSALVVSLMVTVGMVAGLQSGLFAISLVLAAIVMYDAMQVRRSAGEQGVELRKLLKRAKVSEMPHLALGHTPAEVAGGAVVGVVVSLAVVFFVT